MTEAEELRELIDVLVENQAHGYINGWSIASEPGHLGSPHFTSSPGECTIRAAGIDLSTIEGRGETWDAAKNAFADALLAYLERLEPVASRC